MDEQTTINEKIDELTGRVDQITKYIRCDNERVEGIENYLTMLTDILKEKGIYDGDQKDIIKRMHKIYDDRHSELKE